MVRSALSHTSFAAQIALAGALVIVMAFAVFTLRPQMPSDRMPVTAPQAVPAAVQKLDLGAGYTLVTNAQGTNIVAPASLVKSVPASQPLDLGAGYILRDGQIIAPARPDTSFHRIDLGAGYTLEMTAYNAQIVAPVASGQVPAAVIQKLDLGAGYTLEMTANNAHIVAPVASVKLPPAAIQKFDLGAGYTLEMTATGGQIVAPAAAFAPQPASVQKMDLGAGHWLILTASGGQIVTEGSWVR